jgi:hypothetical protein
MPGTISEGGRAPGTPLAVSAREEVPMETQEKTREKSPFQPAEERKDSPPAYSRIDRDDPVEEASDESFPASDPPSYSPKAG